MINNCFSFSTKLDLCGKVLITLISLIIFLIIIYAIRVLYWTRQLKNQLNALKQVIPSSLTKRNLSNPSSFKLSLSGSLMKQLNTHCLKMNITKSLYLENLVIKSLNKGTNNNG